MEYPKYALIKNFSHSSGLVDHICRASSAGRVQCLLSFLLPLSILATRAAHEHGIDSIRLTVVLVCDYDACARLGEAIQPGAYTVGICSAFKGGKQQEAIVAKIPTQAAWSESWKSMEGLIRHEDSLLHGLRLERRTLAFTRCI
jgi:hypothetical protein